MRSFAAIDALADSIAAANAAPRDELEQAR